MQKQATAAGVARGMAAFLEGLGDMQNSVSRLMANDDDGLRNALILAARSHVEAIGPSEKRAEKILGANIITTDFVATMLGDRFRPKVVPRIPFSVETLEACKDTHILMYLPECSINDLFRRFRRDSGGQSWLMQRRFADERGSGGWRLIRKTPVPESNGKTWLRQVAMLPETETSTSARALVFMVALHQKISGQWLFTQTPVRTTSLNCDGVRIVMASSIRGEIQFMTDRSHESFMIASEMKPDL